MNLLVFTRRVASWSMDAGRLAWASLYWNWRKAAFVRRGRRGSCPCHSPSDDPVPGKVRCQAVLLWDDPARFRRACPLLVRTEHGWCCSVGPGEVRPFWGRTLAAWSGGALVLYLTAVLGVFALVRWGLGVPVAPWQVAWPGRWSHVREAQADQLFRRAMVAFAQGRQHEAMLSLESARAIRPNHYAATRLLGQITMFQGSWAFSDALFLHLMEREPERRAETAVVYHDTLAALDRADELAALCLQMVEFDPGQTAKWVRSLLFALQRSPDAARWLDANAAGLVRLPAHARLLVEAERSIAARDEARAVSQLRAPFGGPYNPTYMQLQIERLAGLGAKGDAQLLMDFYGPMLGRFDAGVGQFSLELVAGDQWAARAELGRLLAGATTGEQVTQIAERLLLRPNADRFRELHERARLLEVDGRRQVAPVLWVVGLVNGCIPEARAWRAEAVTADWGKWADLAAVDFAQRDPRDPRSPLAIIQAVELPREIVFALVARLEKARSPAVRPARVLP